MATFGATWALRLPWFTNYVYLRVLGNRSNSAGSMRRQILRKMEAQRTAAARKSNWTNGDGVNGPMHTNDAADVNGATFGRSGQSPPDAVEINGGTYPS